MQDSLFDSFQSSNKEDWANEALKSLKGATLESLNSSSYEGIEIKPYYDASMLDKELMAEIQLISKKTHLHWNNYVNISVSNEQEANQKAKEALANGAISIHFDLKGKADYHFDTLLKDLEDGKVKEVVVLNNAPFSLWQNKELYDKYWIVFSNDPLHQYLLDGKDPSEYLSDYANAVQRLVEPSLAHPIAVHTKAIHNAGGNAVQELATALAMGVEYINLFQEKGIEVKKFINNIDFCFCTGTHFFMEVAKLRAFRWLWNKVVKAYFPQNSTILYPTIYTETSFWNKSPKDAYNNMLRATLEASAGIVGGANGISVYPYNAPFSANDEFSERIARNTPTLLKEESYLHKVNDVSAGTYLVEYLTQQLGEKAWHLFQEIEQEGGFLASCKSLFLPNLINKTAQQKIDDFKTGKLVLVGVNKYENAKDEALNNTFQVHSGAILDTTPLVLR